MQGLYDCAVVPTLKEVCYCREEVLGLSAVTFIFFLNGVSFFKKQPSVGDKINPFSRQNLLVFLLHVYLTDREFAKAITNSSC